MPNPSPDANADPSSHSASDSVAPPVAVSFAHSIADPERHVLIVRGELDIATASSLQRELSGLLEDGAPRVEVDLSEVVFMDSSALSALVGAHERAKLQGQHLALLHPSPACAKVLGITGLDRVFDLS